MNGKESSIIAPGVPVERTGPSLMPVGMILFLISESFLFGALFWAYFYLRNSIAVWPPAGVSLDTGRAGINMAILLVSSGSLWWAGNSIRQGKEKGLASGLAITLALGVIFIGITIFEWTQLNFRPWTTAYGSIFFTLTGFHALHVFGGVLLLSALLTRALNNRFTSTNFVAVTVSSFYWYYINFILIVVFIVVYIVK